MHKIDRGHALWADATDEQAMNRAGKREEHDEGT